jgi:hypothetical protein
MPNASMTDEDRDFMDAMRGVLGLDQLYTRFEQYLGLQSSEERRAPAFAYGEGVMRQAWKGPEYREGRRERLRQRARTRHRFMGF